NIPPHPHNMNTPHASYPIDRSCSSLKCKRAAPFHQTNAGRGPPGGGHPPSAKALFLMEGVTGYLPAQAVITTLRFIAKNSARGGGIVFDYFDRRLLEGEGQTPYYKSNTATFRSWGEPQIFGIPGYDSQRYAEQHGLRLLSDYTSGELCLLHTPRLNPA